MSSSARLPWSTELLQRNGYPWDWERLSANPHPPWSAAWISPFEEQWNWVTLSSQKNLPWNADFFNAFATRWFVPLVAEHRDFGVRALSAREVQALLSDLGPHLSECKRCSLGTEAPVGAHKLAHRLR